MQTRIYTVHHKGSEDIRAVADQSDWLAIAAPPLWAVWHGLWLTLAAQAALIGLAALWSPLAILPVYSGLAAILGFEGGAVHRTELKLRRWHEATVVEARSPEGAEELFFRGEAA